MRFKANKMGYSLNQRGLYSGVVRDPKDRRVKTSAGTFCNLTNWGRSSQIANRNFQDLW